MKNLASYIDQRNFYATIFKRPAYDANALTPRQMQELLDSLEADLSPENLCCDGELRGNALRTKERMLRGAMSELLGLAKRDGVHLNKSIYA